MEYAPIEYSNSPPAIQDDYPSESFNFNFNNPVILDKGEPIKSVKNIYEESIVLKELLIDILQGREIVEIDNENYKNEEIDKIVEKIDLIKEDFDKLQDELNEIDKEYQKQVDITEKNVNKIKETIKYMKNIEEDYKVDESVKELVTKMNEYSQKIYDNDRLGDIKKRYIEKRKQLNSHLYFIQKINKWNTTAICPICITEKIDSYCNPCGHTACKKCLERNSRTENNINSNKCPICREYVMDIRKLYFI